MRPTSVFGCIDMTPIKGSQATRTKTIPLRIMKVKKHRKE